MSRLKRVQSYSPKLQTPIPEACIYSTYLILFSCVLSSEYSVPVIKHNPPSLAQILQSRLHISRPLSISSGSGLSSHHDLILQSIHGSQQQQRSLPSPIPASYKKKSDLEKVQIDNLETLFGDIELVTFTAPVPPSLAPDPVITSVDLDEEEEHKSCFFSVGKVSQNDSGSLQQTNGVVGEVIYLGEGSKGFVHYQDNVAEEAVMIARAAMEVIFFSSPFSSLLLATSPSRQILFEIFQFMEFKHLHIDETVYRYVLLPSPSPSTLSSPFNPKSQSTFLSIPFSV
jgi:hypothetical protein